MFVSEICSMTIQSNSIPRDLPAVQGNVIGTKKVTVIVPCYNEAETIGFLAEKLREMEADTSPEVEYHYILVDDGSSDKTWDLLQ